jgi:hypothetical protein
MQDATAIERIRLKFLALAPVLDERSRRQWAAAEARDRGYGGVTAVATATGLARDTIAAGLRELEYRESQPDEPVAVRLRHGGAGRKRLTESDPTLSTALESLLEPLTRGDPMSPLRWTCKSTRRLATELTGQGHRVGYRTVAWLLHEAGYSLQSNFHGYSQGSIRVTHQYERRPVVRVVIRLYQTEFRRRRFLPRRGTLDPGQWSNVAPL